MYDLAPLALRSFNGAKKASEATSLEPEVRDALSDVADKLGEGDQNANAMSSRDPQDAAAQKADATGQAHISWQRPLAASTRTMAMAFAGPGTGASTKSCGIASTGSS